MFKQYNWFLIIILKLFIVSFLVNVFSQRGQKIVEINHSELLIMKQNRRKRVKGN